MKLLTPSFISNEGFGKPNECICNSSWDAEKRPFLQRNQSLVLQLMSFDKLCKHAETPKKYQINIVTKLVMHFWQYYYNFLFDKTNAFKHLYLER